MARCLVLSLLIAAACALKPALPQQSGLDLLIPVNRVAEDLADLDNDQNSVATIVKTSMNAMLGTFGLDISTPAYSISAMMCVSTSTFITEQTADVGGNKNGQKITASVTSAQYDSSSGVGAFKLGSCELGPIDGYPMSTPAGATCSDVLQIDNCAYFAAVELTPAGGASKLSGVTFVQGTGACQVPVPAGIPDALLQRASMVGTLFPASTKNICPADGGMIAGIVIACLVVVGAGVYGGLIYGGILPVPSCFQGASAPAYNAMAGSASTSATAPPFGKPAPSGFSATAYQQA